MWQLNRRQHFSFQKGIMTDSGYEFHASACRRCYNENAGCRACRMGPLHSDEWCRLQWRLNFAAKSRFLYWREYHAQYDFVQSLFLDLEVDLFDRRPIDHRQAWYFVDMKCRRRVPVKTQMLLL